MTSASSKRFWPGWNDLEARGPGHTIVGKARLALALAKLVAAQLEPATWN